MATRPRSEDRHLAEQLHDQHVPLTLVVTAMLLAVDSGAVILVPGGVRLRSIDVYYFTADSTPEEMGTALNATIQGGWLLSGFPNMLLRSLGYAPHPALRNIANGFAAATLPGARLPSNTGTMVVGGASTVATMIEAAALKGAEAEAWTLLTSGGTLSVLGTWGGVAGAGYLGWQIGTVISDIPVGDTSVGNEAGDLLLDGVNAVRDLFGYGAVEEERRHGRFW